jgi:hypothetical protein
MTEPVVPLQMVLFQVIFLFVAIALEARVFHRRLRIPRRTSVEYATSINLLTVIIGWLAFFLLKDVLPQPLKSQLISFIFFDHLLEPHPVNLSLIIVSTGILLFFAAFFIKLKGLEVLEALVQSSDGQQRSKPPEERRRPTLSDRFRKVALYTNPNEAIVVLLANAYSHSAILLILFIRFLSLRATSTLGY